MPLQESASLSSAITDRTSDDKDSHGRQNFCISLRRQRTFFAVCPPQSGRQSSLPSAFLRSSQQSARDGSRQALPPLVVNGGFVVCLPLFFAVWLLLLSPPLFAVCLPLPSSSVPSSLPSAHPAGRRQRDYMASCYCPGCTAGRHVAPLPSVS